MRERSQFPMTFDIDKLALIIAAAFGCILWLAWRWREHTTPPHLLFSDLNDLRSAPASWRVSFSLLPRWLELASLGLFLLAFIDPHFFIPKPGAASHIPREGIAIYLVTDQSGSMKEKVSINTPDGLSSSISKIDLLKQITSQFVLGNPSIGLSGRPDDLIGLVEFARTAHVMSPLTFNHQDIVNQLKQLNVVQSEDQDGTALGYSLFKTANLIAATRYYANNLKGTDQPPYNIKSAIIILITDGFDNPSLLDKGNPLRNIDPISAAEYAKEKNVRIYIISIDPILGSEKYTPQRHQMERVASLTGGKYYLISQANGLTQIYKDIDSLEKSALPADTGLSKDEQPHRYQRISLYPYLIGLGMLALIGAICLKTILLRQVP